MEPLHVLAAGDQSDEPIELKRIMTLAKHYAYLRRTRADGNCFFRSFMFSYLEHVLETQDRAEVDRIQSNIDKYKKTLQDLGCPGFAIEDCCQERAEAGYIKTNTDKSRKTKAPLDPGQSDFILTDNPKDHVPEMQERQEVNHIKTNTDKSRKTLLDPGQSDFVLTDYSQPFTEMLEHLMGQETSIRISSEELLQRSRDEACSDSLVKFLRCVTSAEILRRPDYFKSYVTDGTGIVDFCKNSVEPMGEKIDRIHIMALSDALGVPIRVFHLKDQCVDKLHTHDFIPPFTPVTKPFVHLLSWSGRFAILYPK